jgi:hypothetical protein
LVVDDDGFCHLTAPTTFNRPPRSYSRAFGPHRKCHGSHQFVRWCAFLRFSDHKTGALGSNLGRNVDNLGAQARPT